MLARSRTTGFVFCATAWVPDWTHLNPWSEERREEEVYQKEETCKKEQEEERQTDEEGQDQDKGRANHYVTWNVEKA